MLGLTSEGDRVGVYIYEGEALRGLSPQKKSSLLVVSSSYAQQGMTASASGRILIAVAALLAGLLAVCIHVYNERTVLEGQLLSKKTELQHRSRRQERLMMRLNRLNQSYSLLRQNNSTRSSEVLELQAMVERQGRKLQRMKTEMHAIIERQTNKVQRIKSNLRTTEAKLDNVTAELAAARVRRKNSNNYLQFLVARLARTIADQAQDEEGKRSQTLSRPQGSSRGPLRSVVGHDEQAPAGLKHAVCLTGLERDFATIAVNVREFLFRLLGTPDAKVTFFGVQPTNSSWRVISRMLPMHVVEQQSSTCMAYHGVDEQLFLRRRLRRLIHCSNRGRHDCHGGVAIELCQLAQCESMINAFELKHKWSFDSIHRLRADLSYEVPLRFPWPLGNDTIYVPFMNSGTGVNDQAAFGGRNAMRKYLTRIRYVTHNVSIAQLQEGLPFQMPSKVTSEMILKATMLRDGVQMIGIQRWMYCTHTHKALLDNAGARGCIGRVREKTQCDTLTCPFKDIKYWCTCHRNATCADIRQGREVGSYGHGENPTKSNRSRHMALRQKHVSCADVSGQQLFMRSCSAYGDAVPNHTRTRDQRRNRGCNPAGPCELRSKADDLYIDVESVPDCVFESGAREAFNGGDTAGHEEFQMVSLT